MFVDNLLSKINDALQKLAKLLDLIHKLSSKQREHYFSVIKNLQMQLNTLKVNLKQSNALQIQKQYNAIYLNINSLGSEIQDCTLIMANKQNRDTNRVTPIRESKRTQEEAFQLLAEKEDQINRLKLQNFEKQQLIKINYEELMDYKRECAFLHQQLKMMKGDIAELEKEISSLKGTLLQKEQQIIDLKLVDQERERIFRNHQEELLLTNKELEGAYEKIHYFEHLAEISMNKTQIVQQSIRQLQSEAQKLNENYKVKQNEIIKNCKEKGQLQLQNRQIQTKLNVEREENRRMREDMNLVEEQLTKLNETIYQLRVENKAEKQQLTAEKRELTQKLQKLIQENQSLKKELKQSEDKFIDIFNKYSEMQEQYQHTKQSLISKQQQLKKSQQHLKNTQIKIRSTQKELNFILKEKQIVNQQLSKSLAVNKQYETQINKLKQLVKAKQSQRIKLSVTVQSSNNKLKSLQREQTINQRSIRSLTEQINDYKLKIVRLEQGRKHQTKQIQGLKVRLLKAKIQTIHQLRSNLS